MKHYEEWDEAYTRPLGELPWELGRPRPQLIELIKSGRVEPCKTLDICCGAGTNTVYLAQQGFEVTGIDISEKAIDIANKKAENANVNIRFDIGSSVDLPYANAEFGLVHDLGCFHHIHPHDRKKFVEGIHRVLIDDGVYYMTCFSDKNGSGWNRFTKQQIKDIFAGHFSFESIEHISSIEGDGKTRFFYVSFMRKRNI